MSGPEIFTPDEVDQVREYVRDSSHPAGDLVLRLCATVDAQAEVIQRYENGWVPSDDTPGMWFPLRAYRLGLEPMSEAHQLVVYGAVVAPRSEP